MSNASTIPPRRFVISRKTYQGQYFTEQLNETTSLDLMLIPGGTFSMGQTQAEREELIKLLGEEDYQKYCTHELPRHQVTVPTFALGKYPITQAQWRAVAAYPVAERELKPNPSHFSGDNRPVGKVSWDDANEFCLRLGAKTGRTYRLPSEAEWEYACRAGTTTPFHYGETLSDDLANYCAQDKEIEGKLYKGTYSRGIQGKYRQETTEVGLFPPNPFGLYDMHGNVWEWCADDWHDYTGAPRDGSVWLKKAGNNQNAPNKLVRGGSWSVDPGHCRSASRFPNSRDGFIIRGVGFRVCCVVPIALLGS
jgi:formylglycine-generating enzyme required for sulfatase activity